MSQASARADMFAGTTDAVEGGEDIGTLDARALAGSYLQAMRSVPRVAHASTKLAAEMAKIALGRSTIEAVTCVVTHRRTR